LRAKKLLGPKLRFQAGQVPDWIIDEANEDLDILASTLEQLDIVVHRPKAINFQERGGMYNYCPRDRFLIHGTTLVDPAMMYPCRDIGSRSFGGSYLSC